MSVAMETAIDGDLKMYTERDFQKRLQRFEDLIRDITYRSAEATLAERRQWISENLRFDQFCEKVRTLFGSGVENYELKAVYQKISTTPDAEVDWSELYSCFRPKGHVEQTRAGDDLSIFMLPAKKRVGDRRARDSIHCLAYIQALDCYICCSQKGALSLWTGQLRLQSAVDINEPFWVTGCDYLHELKRVGCCTYRSIVLWDNRAKSQNLVVIKPIDDTPLCMASVASDRGDAADWVLYGDDRGFVSLLTITGKDLALAEGKASSRKSKSDVCVIDPGDLSTPIQRRKLHNDCVLKVKYFPELRRFGSCSLSSVDSFVLENIATAFTLNEPARSASIPKGVTCFELCSRANLIATGGRDMIVRLWHPHVLSRPTGKLVGHMFTIVDITINERDQHVISLCGARVFRVWDIRTLTCLQVFTNSQERPGERRVNTIIFDNINERLLAGSSVIETWPLSRTIQNLMQVPHTHDKAIVQVLLNKELNQVVSVCNGSVIKAWKMDTGEHAYSIPDAHGPNVEITAFTLDESGSRMASGALDGSIRLWDCAAGHVLKAKQNSTTLAGDLAITGIVCSKNKDGYLIVACGWNNKLRVYLDAKDSSSLVLLQELSERLTLEPTSNSQNEANLPVLPEPCLKDFSLLDSLPPNRQPISQNEALDENVMTCMTSLTSDLLATGCRNGSLILWSVKESCIKKALVIHKRRGGNNQPRQDSENERVNDIKLLVHKKQALGPSVFKNRTDKHRQLEQRTQSRRSLPEDWQASVDTNTFSENTGLDSTDGMRDAGTITGTRGTAALLAKRKQTRDDDKTEITVGKPSVVSDTNAHIADSLYRQILVSAHNGSIIRFWDMSGVLVQEISPAASSSKVHVTAICHDDDSNTLVTGDSKGYLAMWNLGHLLKKDKSQDDTSLTQIVHWRGHRMKIVTLLYVEAKKVILSGSLDGSVRVWWGAKGTFVGFFGQYYPFHFPSAEEVSDASVLPFDINEEPVTHVKGQHPLFKVLPAETLECPLIFDNTRWEPLRRSANIARKDEVQRPENKFFRALNKPKIQDNHFHRDSFIEVQKTSGAIYRTLPVYRVCTPKMPKTPDICSNLLKNDEEVSKSASVTLTGLVVNKIGDPHSSSQHTQLKGRAHRSFKSVRGSKKRAHKFSKYSPLVTNQYKC